MLNHFLTLKRGFSKSQWVKENHLKFTCLKSVNDLASRGVRASGKGWYEMLILLPRRSEWVVFSFRRNDVTRFKLFTKKSSSQEFSYLSETSSGDFEENSDQCDFPRNCHGEIYQSVKSLLFNLSSVGLLQCTGPGIVHICACRCPSTWGCQAISRHSADRKC